MINVSSEQILNKIAQIYSPISPACRKDLVYHLQYSKKQKGETVVHEGQYSEKAYLVIEGCSRAYYLKDGKDISDWFAFENEFMASIVSFFTEAPSPHYIEFIEDSYVVEFSKTTIERLCVQHHDFERLISKVVTNTMLGLRARLSSILFNTAEERYNQLLAIRPDITNRVPLKHIASYLGITLETLSRIRKPKRLNLI
ncbi:Crp/Fnr family transcriptional regulator [Roseivirga pacifica]|uniref:Crp/Fnr family transcriptional regulator n=1 Tax=Roseivirga pacifica TaxID=1267423 RepID=UPI003BAFDAA0